MKRKNLIIVCNSREDTIQVMALNFDLHQDGAQDPSALPSRLMLLPAGDRVTGRDGRSWAKPNPQAILDYFTANRLDIPFDIEHATQLKAPKGEAAPAMAWGNDLRIESDGSISGAVQWNQEGTELVGIKKSYRYYSPAYVVDNSTGTIVGIKSVGLTNTPNLEVPALNHQQEKGAIMNLAALLASLGLAPTATFDEALNHIAKLRGDLTVALNAAQNPPLDKFVPKADYDLALNRANDAEGKLNAQAKEALETAINSEIDAALKAGKITPATKDYHVAQCRQEGGLDRFKAFCQAAPSVAADTNLDTKKTDGSDTALNAEEAKIAAMFGNSAEDLQKYGK